MVGFFWKKLTLLNLGLLIVILRIFQIVSSILDKYTFSTSIFPDTSPNGYPFFESIDCNIREQIEISSLFDNYTENEQNLNFYLNTFKLNNCSFYNKLQICKEDRKCYNDLSNKIIKDNNFSNFLLEEPIYHKNILNSKDKINKMNIIYYMHDLNYINEKESLFLYKIISGYSSYLTLISYIKENKKNYDLLKQITMSENKLNELNYFHSLFIKAYLKLNKNSEDDIFITNNTGIMARYTTQCIDINKSKINIGIDLLQQKFFNKLNLFIDCINDIEESISFKFDNKAIEIMMKALTNKNYEVNKFEKLIIKHFLVNLNKAIYNIFKVDLVFKKRSTIFGKINYLVLALYWIIAFVSLVFTNKYFIKHKEFYNGSKRRYVNTNRNNYYMNRYKKYQENLKKIQEREAEKQKEQKANQGKKLTEQELKTLADQFVVSKDK